MKRIWIKRAITGSILIAIIVVGLGFAGYKWAKQYYYDELENRIENLYLEGRDAIGFYAFSPEISAKLYSNEYEYKSVSELKYDDSSNVRTWPSLRILNGPDYQITHPYPNPCYLELANSSNFSWWISIDRPSDPLIKFTVFLKEKKDYCFIDECIMGIGFQFLPPNIIKTTNFLGEYIYIYKDFSLYNSYINYLVRDKYEDINMRRNAGACNRLIGDLRQNTYSANRGGELYFGNEFYELRPYANYLDGGNIYVDYNTYGNAYQKLYGATVTVKYSIQAKGTVLEDTFLKRTSIAGVGLILAYIIFCTIMNNKKVKS